MAEVFTFITAYAIGISQNASWDIIKGTFDKFKSANINFERLFIDSFYKAIDIHGDKYSQLAKEYSIELKRIVLSDERKFLKIINSISYGDYSVLLSDLANRSFQNDLSTKIIDVYSFGTKLDNTFRIDLLNSVVNDVISLYQLATLREISEKESTRIILLQVLKIDEIKRAIEGIANQIISKSDFDAALEQNRDFIRAQIDDYTRYYQEHKKTLDSQIQLNKANSVFISVKKLLKASGYKQLKFKTPKIDIIAESSGVFSTRVAVKINTTNKEVNKDDVLEFELMARKSNSHHGYYISTSGFSLDTIRNTGDNFIKKLTYEDFANQLVDFTDYINDIISKYKSEKSNALYQDVFANKANKKGNIDLLNEVGQLLTSNNREVNVAILGDYGMGKTMFSSRLHYKLAEDYSNSISDRIPVLISLKKYERVSDINSIIVHTLQQSGVNVTHSICSELQRLGRFVFLFDGFDEMSLRSDKISTQRNLRELEKVTLIGNNQMLLTSRTHFFKDRFSEKILSKFNTYYLSAWSKDQILSYTKKALGLEGEEYFKNIFKSSSLQELSKTPLFLDMLIKSNLKELTQEITAYNLFDTFTNNWIDNQDYRSRMTRIEKKAFMGTLAVKLYFENRFSIHFSELRDIVRKTFNLNVIEDVDYFDNDSRTCSFLIRDNQGNYKFSHRSFMEFFVSKEIVEEIIHLKDGKIIPNKLIFGRKKYSNAIYMFLSESSIDSKLLLSLIEHTKNKRSEEVLYIGTNAITILKYREYDLTKSDFSDTVLVDADLGGANLNGSKFERANLYTANFNNCNLDKVSMFGANLKYASIKATSGIMDFSVPTNNNKDIYVATLNNKIYNVNLNNLSQFAEFIGHTDGVWRLGAFKNRPYLVSGGRDNILLLWDYKELELIRSFEGHHDNIWSIAINNSDTLIASSSSDKLVKIWDVDQSSALLVFDAHTDEVRDIAFTSKRSIVSCGLNGEVYLWDCSSGKISASYKEEKQFHSLCISNNQRQIAVGDEDGDVHILDAVSLRLLSLIKVHNGIVRSITFCGDSVGHIISGGGDNFVNITNLSNQKTKKLCKHESIVNKVRYIESTHTIMSAGFDGNIYVSSLRDYSTEIINLSEIVNPTEDYFSCKGLILEESTGLSKGRIRYLQQKGAKI